jgi:hypothetical protein
MAMIQTNFRETREWLKGHNGELLVAKMLQDKGWFVIPSYDYSGEDNNKAPKLQGLSACYVIPDLDISKDGRRMWAEVKTKSEPTFTRITQRYEHGIPRRHYLHYLKVQEVTGCDVWLFIYEESSGEVLCGAINALSECRREYDGWKMSNGGMVFFPRDAFKVWATLE